MKFKKIVLLLPSLVLVFTCLSGVSAGVVDEFEDTSSWQSLSSGLKKFEIKSETGVKGRAMVYEFDFGDKTGYAGAGKEINLKLPESCRFTFMAKGEAGGPVNLEFKLIDNDGNTFWRKIQGFKIPVEWQKITVKSSDLVFAWGPGAKGDLRDAKRMELIISAEKANLSGRIVFDSLLIEETVPDRKEKVEIDYSGAIVTASGEESALYSSKQAFDGDMKTRWSSPHSDPQWIAVDLGKITEFSGLLIYWEDAFGKDYIIELSQDGKKWEPAATVIDGNGGTDMLSFSTRKARHIRISGSERGTAWGYSIFEVKILSGPWPPKLTVSSNEKEAGKIFDGDMKSSWKAAPSASHEITVDFISPRPSGGMIIHYLSPVDKRRVYTSDDAKNWNEAYSSSRKAKSLDYILLEDVSYRYVRIVFETADRNFGIGEIQLIPRDEKLTPVKTFQIAALQNPGNYPMWLSKIQEYWTIIGQADDDKEALVSESGIIEPWHYSHTFFPAIKTASGLITYSSCKLSRSMDENFLPVINVGLDAGSLELKIKSFAADGGRKSSAYARYTIKNSGKNAVEGIFYLLIRPFQVNPPWMHGGLAEIKSVEYDGSKPGMASINGKPALYLPAKPDIFGTAFYEREDGFGDIIEDIADGRALSDRLAGKTDDSGLASAAAGYNFTLKPGESAEYYFAVPLHGAENEIKQSGDFKAVYDAKLEETVKYWKSRLEKVRLVFPDNEFTNTLKANLVYILLNDDMFRLQPGSRNYEASWMRDGSLAALSLLATGFNEEVRRYLEWITGFIKEDGWVPFIVGNQDNIMATHWKEFDSQGQYIYAIYRYYLYTKDRKFLETKKDKVTAVINFIKARRNERKTAEYQSPEKKEFYGILPESQSHEGYIDPPRHSYWDDFWALRGLEDARAIYEIVGDKKQADMAKEEYDELSKCLYESIALVQKKKNIKYIPGCAELGDPDPTSTANGVWPCMEYKNMTKEGLKETFDLYWRDLEKRFSSGWKGAFTPYEIRSANPYIIFGDTERVEKMLYKFFEWKRPREWNHWAEVVTSEYRLPQYLGDMPHTWIGAEFVNVARNMLIMEENSDLYIGRGIIPAWTLSGKKISAEKMPTEFGEVTFEISFGDNSLSASVSGAVKGTRNIYFTLPPGYQKPGKITVNGQAYTGDITGKSLLLKALPSEIEITK